MFEWLIGIQDALGRIMSLSTVKKPFFGQKVLIMGILNVTPDSFSDGGSYMEPAVATEHALRMLEEGADIIDVGGESTRPGSIKVLLEEEMRRVIPVIKALSNKTNAVISVDTTNPQTARAALDAGASILNDVSNLRDGDELAKLAADYKAYLILMHSRGTPQTMTGLTDYDDIVEDVCRELLQSVETACSVGVSPECIVVDPGIGFAKTAKQSLELLSRIKEITTIGYPIMIGPSRKSFIGEITKSETNNRLGGTAAAVTHAVLSGVKAVRVHDVAVMRQAVLTAEAILASTRKSVGDTAHA